MKSCVPSVSMISPTRLRSRPPSALHQRRHGGLILQARTYVPGVDCSSSCLTCSGTLCGSCYSNSTLDTIHDTVSHAHSRAGPSRAGCGWCPLLPPGNRAGFAAGCWACLAECRPASPSQALALGCRPAPCPCSARSAQPSAMASFPTAPPAPSTAPLATFVQQATSGTPPATRWAGGGGPHSARAAPQHTCLLVGLHRACHRLCC